MRSAPHLLEDGDWPASDEQASEPDEIALELAKAQTEIAKLRATVGHLEQALRAAARVLAPYCSRPRA
jgi:hypothetical protein